MICKSTFLLGMLLELAKLAQPRLGGERRYNRLLGRWSFDEPCIAGPILYENATEGSSRYDVNLRQYSRINGRMYEDEALTLPMNAYSDVLCNIIAPDHIMCNYYMIDDTVGVFSLFSGIAKFQFSDDDGDGNSILVVPVVGTGRYVYQGGSDLHAGILGKVSTIYEKEIIQHDFCIQGSTYNHIVPPLGKNAT